MLSMKPPNICVRLPPLTNYVGYQRYKSVCEHLETNKIIKKIWKNYKHMFYIFAAHIRCFKHKNKKYRWIDHMILLGLTHTKCTSKNLILRCLSEDNILIQIKTT